VKLVGLKNESDSRSKENTDYAKFNNSSQAAVHEVRLVLVSR
jgi:hypothetical protein